MKTFFIFADYQKVISFLDGLKSLNMAYRFDIDNAGYHISY